MKRGIITVCILTAALATAGCGQKGGAVSFNETAAQAEGAASKEAASQKEASGDEAEPGSEGDAEDAATPQYIDAAADEDGNIRIDMEEITEEASYINYPVEDVTIQLIAVRAKDGTVHTAFNTCQICNPSPLAYFVQEGDSFTCQNCGNRFTTEEVGVRRGGCNPAPIEEKKEQDGEIVIDSGYLEQYQGNFAGWQGPTE